MNDNQIKREAIFEEKVVNLQAILKQAISQSKLNVSIIELIVYSLYLEVKILAEQNLQAGINKANEEALKQVDDNKEIDNGDTNEAG